MNLLPEEHRTLQMQNTTFNLPDIFITAFQKLKDVGRYPSRSEAVRVALYQFLSEELTFTQELEQCTFEAFSNEKNSKNPKNTSKTEVLYR